MLISHMVLFLYWQIEYIVIGEELFINRSWFTSWTRLMESHHLSSTWHVMNLVGIKKLQENKYEKQERKEYYKIETEVPLDMVHVKYNTWDLCLLGTL